MLKRRYKGVLKTASAYTVEWCWDCPECGESNIREGQHPNYDIEDICEQCDERVRVTP